MARKPEKSKPVSIAFVSGKGGSGKTLIAASFGQTMSTLGWRVLLVDADLGTGGLTFYLGFNAFERSKAGFVEFLTATRANAPVSYSRPTSAILKDHPSLSQFALLPVGEHRSVASEEFKIKEALVERLIKKANAEFDMVIFDCRGGVDHDSLAVCHAVSHVILVAETDAASIQATQFLSETLQSQGLGSSVAGFILNKAMDDPSSLAKAALSFFRAEYLGAIPFDIETTRGFIRGDLPQINSLFSRHVAGAMGPLFGVDNAKELFQTLRPRDFDNITLKNPDSAYGNMVVLGALLYAYIAYFYAIYVARIAVDERIILGVATAIIVLALAEPAKVLLGRALRRNVELIRRLFKWLP